MFAYESTRKIADACNLRRLFIFRSSVLASELIVMLLAYFILKVELPIGYMLAVLGVYGLFNLQLWFRLNKSSCATANMFFWQLVVDVLALAGLLYFSGGSSNPFVSLFLLPMVIVAATLPKHYVWSMAAVTLCCYTLLMMMNVPLAQETAGMHQHHHGSGGASSFSLHVWGMWFSFLLGVGVILFFVVSMAEALRERDLKLAESREKHLRDEHVVALGTLAAGAAHELGTPLATMAVLTKEMENEYHHDTELVEKIEILRSQVDRCKSTISQISASAGQQKADAGGREELSRYIQQTVEYWQEMHPDTKMKLVLNGSEPVPVIVLDATLNQAILNLLNNAADASPEKVMFQVSWTDSELNLEVRDFGEGLPPKVLESLGSPFFTTKENGQGLGFYLTQAVVRRLGGEIAFANHPDGGASFSITLPLLKLKVN